VIIFGSVWFLSKKATKLKFFFKKNRNRIETGSIRPVSVWFGSGFLGKKLVQTGLTRFWLGFFWFWLGFFCFGSVQFGFFGFLLIKPNRPVFSKF
jgi:hypothetical protein